jgi:transcription elongation GreA/GreB family factor
MKLTREGQERLRSWLSEAQAELLETEEFMRQQLLCRCDLDPISMSAAREKRAMLEERVKNLESTLAGAEVLSPHRSTEVVELGAYVTLVEEGRGQETRCSWYPHPKRR